MFVIWHPVSTSSVGHHQEHECIEKLNEYYEVGDLVIGIFIYSNFLNVLGPVTTDFTFIHHTFIWNVYLMYIGRLPTSWHSVSLCVHFPLL